MREIICNQNRNFKYLPLSFNNNIEETVKLLGGGFSAVRVRQTQDIKGEEFSVATVVSMINIYELFGVQRIMLLDILKYMNENFDIYERYEFLNGFASEFKMIKDTVQVPVYAILKHHINFMECDLMPLINNHIERIEEILKIKNHKSHVRKSLIDKGVVTIATGLDTECLENIFDFFRAKTINDNEFEALKNELLDNDLSGSESYHFVDVNEDTIILFFKIAHARNVFDAITKKNLAKWMYRKIKIKKEVEFSVLGSERTILDKLNGRLNTFQNKKELNANFKY